MNLQLPIIKQGSIFLQSESTQNSETSNYAKSTSVAWRVFITTRPFN